METVLERLAHPSVLITFIVFGLPMIVWGIKSTITGTSRARVIEAELNLKRELVSQGRSAEDIAKIMRSYSGKMDA